MINAINLTLGHRAYYLSAKSIHHLHDTPDVTDVDETSPHEGNNARPAKSAVKGRATCAASGLLLCIISKQNVFLALFVLLLISPPIAATANEVQVVAQRNMDINVHPSDKNIPRHEQNFPSRKLADGSTCVSTSIKVVMSNPSMEFLSCDTAGGKHYVVSGVPDKVVRANRNGIIGGSVEMSMLEGAYLDDTTATLVMPTLGIETLEFKEKKQDVDNPNKGFRSRLSRGSTGTATWTALIIRIVASNDAAPAASEATLSNQVFGIGTETCMCIKCGLSEPQDGLAVCSPPVEGICSASSEITVGCYSESSVLNCECDCGNPSSTTQGTCVNGPYVASDPISVKSQFDTCSIGQLNFEMAGDRDGNSIQIRNGKYESLDYISHPPKSQITVVLIISHVHHQEPQL
jgi:hypothetical protein